MCLVFTPANPRVYTLNTAAWLVLSLCDGRSAAEIGERYAAALSRALTRSDALAEAKAALEDLARKGIVVRRSTRVRRAAPVKTVDNEERKRS